MWEKVKSWFWNSLTVAWAALQASFYAAVALVYASAEFFNQPEIKSQLGTVFTPYTVALIGIIAAFLTFIARMRTLSK